MRNRINLAATISMILADPNSHFYKLDADENQQINEGENHQSGGVIIGNHEATVFDYQNSLKERFGMKNIISNARRMGKSFLRGL